MAAVSGFVHPLDDRWSRALATAPHDVYATPGYVETDAHAHEAEPTGFLVVEDDRVFLVPLLLRAIGLRGAAPCGAKDAVSPYGYPGVVMNAAARSEPGFVDRCFTLLKEDARRIGVCSVFVRAHPLLNAGLSADVEDLVIVRNGATVSIDLTLSEERRWASMRKGHTNAINQAVRAGYEVDIAAGLEHFDVLAEVYGETLERLGAASRDEFDRDRLHRLASLGEARIAVARLGSVTAAAYLFYECNGFVQMHVGGTRSAYMRPSPSNLLIHAVARWSQERGNLVVHLGGGVGSSETDSLFRFKTGFSPARHDYCTVRVVTDRPYYDRLVSTRAQVRDGTDIDGSGSGFFPAYRAGMAPGVPGVGRMAAAS